MQETYHKREHLYFLPVGGRAMASLAGLLQAGGHRVEFDHPDIHRDLDAVLTAFGAGTAQVPRHGAVV